MKTCIFDLETFTLHADTGILLCCSYKTYGINEKVRTIRADQFSNWEKRKSDVRPIAAAIINALSDYDIFVAHNGQYFDRAMLLSWALKYRLSMFLRMAKFIDPMWACRKHLRLSRNSLHSLAQFLDIEETKTDILWEEWKKAAYDGNRRSMDYIVEHCEADVIVLEKAHERTRKLVKEINERGSAW